jgi:hypothetical protein
MRTRWLLASVASATLGAAILVGVTPSADAASTVTAVPRPDHVVVVVEENHSGQQIIGNPSAGYINSLAATGANLTNFFAETHPSQPNYLALFSGGTQGVTTDACPQSFGGATLGSLALQAGVGFVGYSEGLPSVGYLGCTSGKYVRKHNPWSNFTNVPASASRPFTDFPTDYSQLPGVSFVIPNQDNDMHDGSIAQGDAWLQSNLSAYADWARTHNSLLVVTFDEDDYSQNNQIATIVVGQQVQPGSYGTIGNHYNLLRTIEDGFGLPPLGASATAQPILDIWKTPGGNQPPVAVFSSSCVVLVCSFDAGGSSDGDGSVVSYGWSFGDGGVGSGVAVSHTYAVGGPVAVTLRVTDDGGGSSSVTRGISPVSPVVSPFVSDAFGRTVQGGLGVADVGGAWSVVGPASQVSVSPGAAVVALARASQQVEGFVGPVRTDADVVEVLGASRVPVGGPLYLTVTPRRVGAGAMYGARVWVNANGSVTVRLVRAVGGVSTTVGSAVTVPGVTYTAGVSLSVRVQAFGTGPTTLRARVWRTGQVEPGTWQVSVADSTAGLQTGGVVGTTASLSSTVTNAPVAVTVTSFTARPTG